MASDKENLMNPPAVEDDDDEAFLPPDFLKPEAQRNPIDFLGTGKVPFHDDDLLQSDVNNVSVDLLRFDSPAAFAQSKGNDSGLLAVIEKSCSEPLETSEAATDNGAPDLLDDQASSKPAADQELNLKLDALTADLEAELQVGNLLLDQVSTPITSSVTTVASQVVGVSRPASDVAAKQEHVTIEATSTSVNTVVQKSPTAEALSNAQLLIGQLKKENRQLAAQLEKASDEMQNIQLNAAAQLDGIHEQYRVEIDLLQQEQETTTLLKATETAELLASQATMDQEAAESANGKIRHLQRRMGALKADLKEQEVIQSVEDNGKIRHLQRLLGALESDLQEQTQSKTELESQTAAEAKHDKEKIRSLQRRLGALDTLLQETATKGLAEDKGKIQSLQRRLGAVEADRQEHAETTGSRYTAKQ